MIKIVSKNMIRIVGSYFRDTDGWRRMKSLDRECCEQRKLQVWENNNIKWREKCVKPAIDVHQETEDN